MEPEKFPCKQCGTPFDAYAPDHLYTFAMRKQCSVCLTLNLNQFIEQQYSCDNCPEMTTMYWHTPQLHTPEQKELAKKKRDRDFWDSLGKKLH